MKEQESWASFLMAGFMGSEEPAFIRGWNIGSPLKAVMK